MGGSVCAAEWNQLAKLGAAQMALMVVLTTQFKFCEVRHCVNKPSKLSSSTPIPAVVECGLKMLDALEHVGKTRCA